MGSVYLSQFGPAFLVCVGYLDPGKWATILEGGSRFGLDLLWVLILSSAFSALLYSLSSRLGLATGRSLAQIYHDEYPKFFAVLLWIQCEVSVVILDITVVLGIAIGLNALLGISLASGVVLAVVDAVVFLVALPHMGMRKAEHFTTSLMSFVLFCFVIEALHSNATTAAVFYGMLPRLKGETLYIAAGMIGANIMPFNFYLHSAVVQGGKRAEDQLCMALLPHSIKNIAAVCSMSLLINIAVLSSAAAAFHNSGHVVITFQDAQALMEQVLSSSVAPAAFVFAFLCACQLSTLTGSVAGQIALEGLIGAHVSLSFHCILIRVVTIILVIFLVWNSGSEGTYQILIFSQVILSLQLPYAIVPLIKVTSSKSVMGHHKNSWIVEALAWVYVTLIFFMNIWVVFDMFLGESDDYVVSGSWNLVRDLINPAGKWGDIILTLSQVALVGVTTLSTFFLMWLISVPLKSDSIKLCMPASPVEARSDVPKGALVGNIVAVVDSKITSPLDDLKHNVVFSEEYLSNNVAITDNQLTKIGHELIMSNEIPMYVDISKTESVETGPVIKLNLAASEHPEEKMEPLTCLLPSENATDSEMSLISFPEEDSEQNQSQATMSPDDFSYVDSFSSMHSSSIEGSLSGVVSPPASVKGSESAFIAKDYVRRAPEALKLQEEEVDIELLDKDDYDIDIWENLEQDEAMQGSLSSVGGSINSMSFEEAESGKSFSARSDTSEGSCGGSGSGSLSRLSGLGRAARRQFAALLDEFWSELYDLHGQPISQTHKRWQGGLAVPKVAHTDKVSYRGSAAKETFDRDSSWFSPQLTWRSYQKNAKNDEASQAQAFVHPSYRGSALDSSCFAYGHLQEMPKYSSFSNSLNERRYSSLRYPSYHSDFDNQPATIHGYKSASFAGRLRNSSAGLESRTPSLYRHDVEPCQSFAVGSNKSLSVMSSCGFNSENTSTNRSVQCTQSSSLEGLGNSFLTNSVAAQAGIQFPPARTHFDTFDGPENAVWDPLMYRVTAESDVAHINTRQWEREGSSVNFPPGKQPIGRGVYSRNKNTILKHQTDKAPLSFDEISPSRLHKDGFSIQASSQLDNHSLWSIQPFEQLFGLPNTPSGPHKALTHNESHIHSTQTLNSACMGTDFEIEVLNCLRSYVRKLLRLDGSSWLFRLDSGSDEDLIGIVADRERVLIDADTRELHKLYRSREQVWNSTTQRSFGTLSRGSNEIMSSTVSASGVPHCGEGCVWTMDLVVSFGVWCIHRVLELSLMESRPELWGKYTYVLNRLQGVLEPAFSKPRSVLSSCICVISETSDTQGRCTSRHGSADLSCGSISNGFSGSSYIGSLQSWPCARNTSTCKGKGASSAIFLEIIKDVEIAIGARKGRTGTAAGDVAFPKGKENLASVLKRYKRRLTNKTGGAAVGAPSNTGNRRS